MSYDVDIQKIHHPLLGVDVLVVLAHCGERRNLMIELSDLQALADGARAVRPRSFRVQALRSRQGKGNAPSTQMLRYLWRAA